MPGSPSPGLRLTGRCRRLLPWVALCCASGAAGAQTVAEQVTADLRDAGKDMVAVWSSPFHATSRDWLLSVGVLGLSAAATRVDPSVDRWAVDHAGAAQFRILKEVRQGGAAYAGHTVVPFALAAYGAGVVTRSRDVRDGIMGCAASYASESLARTQVVYRLVARARPDTIRAHDPDAAPPPPAGEGSQYGFSTPGSSDWVKHSFPGGHVANIVSCVTFLSHRFHMGVAEPAMYAVAAGVGLGRLLDRAHWTSDQVFGAFVGYAIGRQVAARSIARARRGADAGSPTAESAGASATPLRFVPAGGGVALSWRWSF